MNSEVVRAYDEDLLNFPGKAPMRSIAELFISAERHLARSPERLDAAIGAGVARE